MRPSVKTDCNDTWREAADRSPEMAGANPSRAKSSPSIRVKSRETRSGLRIRSCPAAFVIADETEEAGLSGRSSDEVQQPALSL
jgi:hypothetical protein